ncbi:integrase, catalytic region, zinc finger, CCHC-type containing protein [Tanacetum coccineum]
MIPESVEYGPLIWPTVEENGVIRTKKYAELSAAEKIQGDCDMKATNIILQGLLADIYSPVNHHRVAKDLREIVQLLMQGTSLTKQERECKLYDAFDKFTHIKRESLHTYYLRFTQLINDMNIYKMNMEQFQVNTKFLNSLPPEWSFFVVFLCFLLELEMIKLPCLNTAMAFLMAVASSRFPTTNNQLRTYSNPRNQTTIQDGRVTMQQVQGRQGQNYSGTTYKSNATSSRGNNTSGQTRGVKCYNCQGEGHMARQCTQPKQPSNATWYKEKAMLAEAQEVDEIIGMRRQLEKANKEQNNESITAELERYKERVKIFKHRLNIDLSSHEKMIDFQMDDMIREKLALKEQINSLEQNLSKQIKENESLFKTFTVFKNESKEKENKYMEIEIDLEKKIKELDNIFYKVGQSAQIVHMLTKPQAFDDNTHKQAIGYQNPFYLRKAQRIKPTLYDGAVISKTHVDTPVIDDEETLILEEESRSKMSEKAKNPKVNAKKISYKPIDYANLNSLMDDFETLDVPSELPKVSLVNASLKKLKFHLTQFDSVVKKRTTPNALEEGEWGFEHTKTVFNNEIIPFLKSLKDIFNVFDKDLLNEITEVQTVFDQMEVAVQQSSVDKQCLEIAKKEILLENDRLLQKIMSQDVLLTVMNSMSLNNDSVNMEMQKCESCEKCLNLDAELSKSKQAYNDFLKNYSQLEKHCISLEVSMQLKQEVFQNDEFCVSQNAEQNINHDKCELEPINKELENSVAKLLYENERLCNEINHVKHVFKDQFDLIKQTRVRHKEQSDSLINKLNLKSVENEDLKAQIQDKVFDELRDQLMINSLIYKEKTKENP